MEVNTNANFFLSRNNLWNLIKINLLSLLCNCRPNLDNEYYTIVYVLSCMAKFYQDLLQIKKGNNSFILTAFIAIFLTFTYDYSCCEFLPVKIYVLHMFYFIISAIYIVSVKANIFSNNLFVL